MQLLKTTKKYVAILILLLLCNCSFAQTQEQATDSKEFEMASNYYREGCQKLEKSDFKGALDDFSKSLNYVNSPQAFLNRGYTRAELGDLDGAIADYTNCIEVASGNEEIQAEAFYNRAISFEDKNNYNSALNDYNTAIKLNPTNADYYAQRARLKNTMRTNPQDAQKDMKKALALEPENKNFQELNRKIDKEVVIQKQYAPVQTAVINDYTNISAKSTNPLLTQMTTNQPYTSNETVLRQTENYKSLNEADTLKAKNVSNIENLSDYAMVANEYMKNGEYKTAVEYFSKAIDLNPFSLNNADLYYKRGICKKYLKDYSGAKKDYEKAVLLNPQLGNI